MKKGQMSEIVEALQEIAGKDRIDRLPQGFTIHEVTPLEAKVLGRQPYSFDVYVGERHLFSFSSTVDREKIIKQRVKICRRWDEVFPFLPADGGSE